MLRIFLFLFTAIAFAQKGQLTDAEISGFKQEVALLAENMETLSSDFTQTKHIQLMSNAAISTGKIYYKSPNILKWEYHKPYNYKILFRENQLFINDEGDKSVTNLTSNKLFEKLIGLISGSVNGKLLADNDNFEVTYSKSGKNFLAVIVPRDAAIRQMFHEIILVFNEEYHIDSVKLMEEEGDFTHIEFKNIKINQQLDDALFRQ